MIIYLITDDNQNVVNFKLATLKPEKYISFECNDLDTFGREFDLYKIIDGVPTKILRHLLENEFILEKNYYSGTVLLSGPTKAPLDSNFIIAHQIVLNDNYITKYMKVEDEIFILDPILKSIVEVKNGRTIFSESSEV